MKRYSLVLVWLILGAWFSASQSGAVCPQDSHDSGLCDTMYVEVWPGDDQVGPPGPFIVRFPIYVTHDVLDPITDSLLAFVIPLCYTHNNSAEYCSLPSYWNTGSFYPPGVNRSIFRHLPSMSNPQVHNWMMDQFQEREDVWNQMVFDLGETSHFWLTLIASGNEDQHFGEGSRVLLATMTFKLEDSMNVCLDTCFWPPSSRLAFSTTEAWTYIPRHFLPKCQYIGWPPPHFLWIDCPPNQAHQTNGEFISPGLAVHCTDAVIISVSADFTGQGVENVRLINLVGIGTYEVTANVAYQVTDHCQTGGTVRLMALDEMGYRDTCYFGITLDNDSPPFLTTPDTVRALADHTTGIQVSATDPENDLIETRMNAFWFKSDSLQAPTNPPSYQGGNPGFFTWVPTEAETGAWVASFSATDICGMSDTDLVTILVGVPFCGDCIRDTIINVGDVIFLISYLYKEGPPPNPVCRGDANCNDAVEIGDVMLLINYLFKRGSAPCFGCCDKRSSGALIKLK